MHVEKAHRNPLIKKKKVKSVYRKYLRNIQSVRSFYEKFQWTDGIINVKRTDKSSIYKRRKKKKLSIYSQDVYFFVHNKYLKSPKYFIISSRIHNSFYFLYK